MHRRALAALVLTLAALAGCSDAAAPDEGRAGDGTSAPDGSSAANDPDSGSGEGTVDGADTADSDPPNSAGAGGTTTSRPGGTASSTPSGGTPPPGGGTAASTTMPTPMPPPPVAGCVDAPAGPASVELSFDDDTMRYAGAVAPPCVRIHAAQRLRVTNAANFSSSGSIGAQTFQLAEGAFTSTAALGTTRSVGDVFDVRVNVISATVVVQVLP